MTASRGFSPVLRPFAFYPRTGLLDSMHAMFMALDGPLSCCLRDGLVKISLGSWWTPSCLCVFCLCMSEQVYFHINEQTVQAVSLVSDKYKLVH